MSGLLAGKVWMSALPRHLKPLAATLADIANDDGTSIYPSVGYVAWRMSSSARAVQNGLQELLGLGVLEAVANVKGGISSDGMGLTVHYVLHESKLPPRPPFAGKRKRKGATDSPLKGAVSDGEGCISEPEDADKDVGNCTQSVSNKQPSGTREKALHQRAVDRYYDLWTERYDPAAARPVDRKPRRPMITARAMGGLKRVALELGEDTMILIEDYVTSNHAFWVECGHSLEMFVSASALNRLIAARSTGPKPPVTQKPSQQAHAVRPQGARWRG